MKKIILLTFLFFCFLVLLPSITHADGGIMPEPYYWMRETGQKAVIVFENNTETLIISTTFEGDAKKFAWIIPTPSQPKVSKAPYNLFSSLEKLTETERNYYPQPLGVMEMAPSAEKGVTVIEEKKVDIYDITVLSATDKNSLYDWLKENGYNYPASGKYILDDYINNNWIFTAIKIDSESLTVAQEQLRRGTANPIKLVFSSDKIVYPLKISAVTTKPTDVKKTESVVSPNVKTVPPVEEEIYYEPDPYVPIELYIFSDHKKEAIGFNTDWAGKVDADQIKKLAFDEVGNPWYEAKSKMYLTKLSDSLQASQMKNDVFPVNAENNSPIPPSNFWSIVLWSIFAFLIMLILPTTLFYVIFLLLFVFIKSKIAKVIFLVIQCFIAIIIPVFFALMSIAQPVSGSDMTVWYGILIASLFMMLLMILGIVLEIVKARKKKVL